MKQRERDLKKKTEKSWLFISLKATFYKGLRTWCCFTYYVGYIGNTKLCENCGKRFEYEQKQGKPQIYCPKCAEQKTLENTRLRVQKFRKNN